MYIYRVSAVPLPLSFYTDHVSHACEINEHIAFVKFTWPSGEGHRWNAMYARVTIPGHLRYYYCYNPRHTTTQTLSLTVCATVPSVPVFALHCTTCVRSHILILSTYTHSLFRQKSGTKVLACASTLPPTCFTSTHSNRTRVLYFSTYISMDTCMVIWKCTCGASVLTIRPVGPGL
jgi:hypothetical protein